jgi:phospholipid N-methyltransferase
MNGNSSYGWWHFLWAGLARSMQTGAVVPSQRFLINKMIAPVPEDYAGEIVELGAGPGNLTARLAHRCPSARILTCEINPVLAQVCRRNMEMSGLSTRVTVVGDSAERVLKRLTQRRAAPPDFVISGIPLATLERPHTLALLAAVHKVLAQGGLYIQFQYSLVDRSKIRDRFSTLRTIPVWLNFPPAVIYYARR